MFNAKKDDVNLDHVLSIINAFDQVFHRNDDNQNVCEELINHEWKDLYPNIHDRPDEDKNESHIKIGDDEPIKIRLCGGGKDAIKDSKGKCMSDSDTDEDKPGVSKSKQTKGYCQESRYFTQLDGLEDEEISYNNEPEKKIYGINCDQWNCPDD